MEEKDIVDAGVQLCIYCHSLFCLTLRATLEGGFLITIHNIMVVAADKPYLIRAFLVKRF